MEKEQLCSAIYQITENRPDEAIWFTLSSVATKKLAEVERRLFEVLRDAVSKPFDMSYMQDCIRRYRRQIVFHTESSGTIYSEPIIEDHLFGKRDGSNLEHSLRSLSDFDEVLSWTDQQWRDFTSKWIANAHHISILGVPSKKLSKKLKADETNRVKGQKERLGEEGLKKLAEKLDRAKAENDKPIPPEIIEKFEVPGTESIHFIPTTTARAGLAKKMGRLDNDIQKLVDRDQSDSPLFIHFEHIPTNFVHINLILSTASIPLELKPLLSIYIENFFDTPIERDGKRIEFEDVVTEIEQDTVQFHLGPGNAVGNSELLRIKFAVEPEKYQAIIRWIRDLLLHSIFDVEVGFGPIQSIIILY